MIDEEKRKHLPANKPTQHRRVSFAVSNTNSDKVPATIAHGVTI